MYNNQTVWITGASSGIGKAFALAFFQQGARLILSGRRKDALQAVAQQCGGEANCLILPFETTDYDALPDIVEQAWEHFDGIDVLVNNAGISQRSLAVETPFPVYQQVIDVDLLAPIALSQLVLPRMVAANSGRFIVIASVAGKIGAPLRSGYCAAKHGLFGYFDALRAENAGNGINVHMVAPGSVKTDVSRNALGSDGNKRGESDPAIEAGMNPEAAVAEILQAIAKGDREILIAKGRERLIVWLRRLWPEKAFDKIAKAVEDGYVDEVNKPS